MNEYETPTKEEFLKIIEDLSEPFQTYSKTIFDIYGNDFYTLPASRTIYHSNYPGGLLEHTVWVVRMCQDLYPRYNTIMKKAGRKIGFKKDELIFGAIIHDVGKVIESDKEDIYGIRKIVRKRAGAKARGGKSEYVLHFVVIFDILRELKIPVSPSLHNALYHHHGGYGPKGEMKPMAYILHAADLWAAQVMEYAIPPP